MRVQNTKVTQWDGENKAVVRKLKKKAILSHLKSSKQTPMILTFPGAKARLEKDLMDSGISPRNILGIQTDKTSTEIIGREVIRSLLETLGPLNMPLFVGEFKDFPFSLCQQRFSKDHVLPPGNRVGPWLKEVGPPKFNVMELDFCCPFGQTILQPIETLFAGGLVADNCLMVVNHMKGRESSASLLQYLAASHKRLNNPPSYLPPKIAGTLYRYSYILEYYHSLAWEYGFSCMPTSIFEYKDTSEARKGAVNMIQYFFAIKKIANKKSFAALKASFTRGRRRIYTEALAAGKSRQFFGAVFKKQI